MYTKSGVPKVVYVKLYKVENSNYKQLAGIHMSMIEYIVKTTHFPRWLFDKGTRVVEVLNSLFLIGFASTFIYNFEGILSLPSYKAFAIASSAYWWIGMFVLGVVQFMSLIKTSLHSNQVSGIILISSAWVWGMVAVTFIASLPPLTSAPIVYTIFSIVCGVGGLYLLKSNKMFEEEVCRKIVK